MTRLPLREMLRDLSRSLVMGLVTALMVISVLLAVGILLEPYFDSPPLHVEGLNKDDLGVLCPGDSYAVHNMVTVDEPVIGVYYVSVLDVNGIFNLVGLQEVYAGYQHPIAGTFDQYLPWTVPNLPQGNYIRSFAARGTDTSESTIFITSTFTIGGKACNEGH